MTRFRDVQQAIIMATVWIDDDKIKSDYNMKKTWNYVCVVTQNDETSVTNDNVTTKTNTVHMKRDTWQVSVHVVFLLVRVVVIFTHCTPHRVTQGSACLHSSHPCIKWASLFDFELSILSNFLFSYSPSISRSSHCPSTSTRISSNTEYSANKEMGSTDESYSHTWLILMNQPLQPFSLLRTFAHHISQQIYTMTNFTAKWSCADSWDALVNMASLYNINHDGAFDGPHRGLEDFQFDLECVLTMSQLVGKSAEERNAASVLLNIPARTKNKTAAEVRPAEIRHRRAKTQWT